MKPFLRIIIITICLLGSLQPKAQSTFELNINSIDDSSYYYNSFILANLTLKYNGAPTYTGLLRIGVATENSGIIESDTVSGFSQQLNQITTNQEIPVMVEIPVSPSFFMEGGGHTVIVWPILAPLPLGATYDSTGFEVEILGWLSQTEWTKEKQAKIFPVPAQDFIMLEKPQGMAKISVIDLMGRTISEENTTETQLRISLEGLRNGLYYIRYSDGIKLDELHSFIKR